MKKVLLSVTGIALMVVLLAALGGVALAAYSEEPMSFNILKEQASDDLNMIVIEQSAGVKEEASTVVNAVQDEIAEEAVELPVAENLSSQELEDDDSEDEHPEGEHAAGGCGGYADPSKLAAKIDAAAEFLGLTPEEVAAQVQAGKRLYEIAAEQGADVEAFKNAVHAVVNETGGCGCGSH